MMHAFMRRKFTLRDGLARVGSYSGLEDERRRVGRREMMSDLENFRSEFKDITKEN